jgi:hypothetical protein
VILLRIPVRYQDGTQLHTIGGEEDPGDSRQRGYVDVLGAHLHAKNQARIDPEAALTLTARSDVQLVLIDVPSCRGWGYDQDTLRGVRR